MLIYQEKNVQVDENNEQVFADDESEFQQIATPRTIMGLNRALLDNSQIIMGMGEEDLKEYVSGFTGDTLFTEAVVASVMANKFKLSTPSKVEAWVFSRSSITGWILPKVRKVMASGWQRRRMKRVVLAMSREMTLPSSLPAAMSLMFSGSFSVPILRAVINVSRALVTAAAGRSKLLKKIITSKDMKR